MADSNADLTVKLAIAGDLAKQPNLPPTLAALVPRLAAASAAFTAAETAVRNAVMSWEKEAPEAAAAIAELGKIYDAARDVARIYVPGVADDGVAGRMVPARLIEAARSLGDVFDAYAQTEWAPAVAAQLEAALTKAEKELDDKTRAGAAEQTARAERASVAKLAWTELREFRRMVRRAYGPSSRQHHSLRTRSGGSGSKQPDDPPPSEG